MRSKKNPTQTQKKPLKKPILFCHMNTFASEDLKTKHSTLTFLTAKKIQLEKYGEGQRNRQVFIIF